MRSVNRSMAVAGVAVLTLFASACGGGGDSGSEGQAGGDITVAGCNPENPLVPNNTAETCGGDVLDVSVARLVKYNVDTAEPEMDIAQSIETDDNQNFTVKLKDYTFSDGTPVTASSFVDAWNHTAYQPNGFQGGYFFEPIAGYTDVQCQETNDDGECTKDPKSKTMSGLKVVDDKTFTIKTSEKVSNLPLRLGYTAFAPLPDAFFKDPEAFGNKPVSAGPYVVEQWDKNKQIVLKKNPEYSGDFPGKPDSITFKIYTNENAAYRDVVGSNLDVTQGTVPTDVLKGDIWKTELPERNAEKEVGIIQLVGFNAKANPEVGNPDVRKAISMAIDRKLITDKIFFGSRTPATGWVSPIVDGFKEGQCGEYCNYDPEAAKALLKKAGGLKKPLELVVNGDADHGPWAEATCNSIRQALGVECTVRQTVDFDVFLGELDERKVGFFRSGWQMDYPSIENFLVPLYSKGAASNYYDYDNPKFAQLNREAAAAESIDDANALYQEAERELAKDMPAIPLWYSTAQVGWSDRVNEVKLTPFGVPDYANITLK